MFEYYVTKEKKYIQHIRNRNLTFLETQNFPQLMLISRHTSPAPIGAPSFPLSSSIYTWHNIT